MVSYVNFWLLCFWISALVAIVVTFPRANPALEILDELHDAEIYKAVLSSMNDWKRKQEQKKITNRLKREDTVSACYRDLGCFEASGPFGYLDTVPDKPEDIGTKFLMYPGRRRRKRGSPPAEVPFEKLDDAFEWAKDGFNGSLPTKVLVHGFGSDCNYIWVYEIRSALMAVEEVNIICVDWSNGAALPNYVKASANTRLVGKQLSLLLRGLVEKNGLSLKKTHIIGFSLGAHIAGFAGSDLGNLSRITGLDPAGPLFESQDPRARLDQSDAEFVDVIHSNGENLILGGLGSSQPMGHVDFYPNGGRMQKGCSHLFVGAVSDIIWSSAVEGRSLCNHRRAYHLFIDSVSPRCHFPAFPCESYEDFIDGKCFPCTEERQCGNMGYYADRSKGRGQLYLITREEEPFCAHQYHVKIETSPSPVPIKSYGKIQITLVGESALNETFMMTRKDDEEMRLGESISRMLVPHPILSQPVQIEILYTAYSGWLSSGLTQWRINKVILMDSFGKTSSVCKKSLILESGKPVLLPLYPGECNIPTSDYEAEDRIHILDDNTTSTTKTSSFIPTQVVKEGIIDKNNNSSDKDNISFKNAMEFFNIPWTNDRENYVLDETESSRAFNTRPAKNGYNDGTIKEIVEPILKPHSSKNARSHDPNKEVEITEPLLGPTTDKNAALKSVSTTTTEHGEIKTTTINQPLEEEDSSIWIPKKPSNTKKEPRKRQDESRILSGFEQPENPIEAIVNTVQFLPQRLARMFEQAEKYAKETILPLVSTYTPRFISDIITPQESTSQKYVPLRYEEPTTRPIISSTVLSNAERYRNNKKFDPPPSIQPEVKTTDFTTPVTNIQKIRRKGESEELQPEQLQLIKTLQNRNKDELVAAESRHTKEQHAVTYLKTTPMPKEARRAARDDLNAERSAPKDPLNSLINTVQVIPENIGKMLHQAEQFARNNVLPFVANLTPKFISDIFTQKPNEHPRYIPFSSDEALKEQNRNRRNRDNGRIVEDYITEEAPDDSTTYSHIQRIPKKTN
ncbi:uncharacterized protein [Diabrotica undecimpunctata]|uniref:uncharacterized protein isoform X2 n=1 Tax=Diabrotica undecimpunctata TaxID=50387 RepID=UPI003B63F4AD